MVGSGGRTVPARRRTGRALALATGVAVATGAAVVAVDVAGAPSARAASLTSFDSCEELVGWYRDSALERVGAYGMDGAGGGMAVTEEGTLARSAAGAPAGAGADAAAAVGGTGAAVGSSGTGTNVQEDGVDEPSRLKLVDGLAYTLTERRLLVADTDSGSVLGTVDLGTGDPGPEGGDWRSSSELLVVGDRVVVLGSASLPGTAGTGAAAASLRVPVGVVPGWGTSTTTVTTVDVSDPTAPVVADRTEVEGGYVSARATGGTVRVVTTSGPTLALTDPWTLQQERSTAGLEVAPEPDAALVTEAEALNEQAVRDADATAWLPDLVTRDSDGAVVGTSPVPCGSVAHPAESAGPGTLTVLALDPAADEPLLGTTSVSADGSLVYASTDRLYVATTRGGWTWRTAEGWRTTTELHGFTTEGTSTDYLGSGSVDGWLLGSWALDAADGHLRVGTTSEGPAAAGSVPSAVPGAGDAASSAAPSTSSSVVVLRETTDGLVETGRVDGLGPGEQIRSLRWFDDLAVVVTFRQTDPLYTVDLSDPADPRVLGELKVTGYSGYLHPVGDDVLLGVGQAGEADGTLTGAKVETYDVRDLAAPGVLGQVVWPGTSSSTEWDSRLFAYLPERRTAVLPVDGYDEATDTFSAGLVAVALAEDGTPREAGRWDPADYGVTVALAADGETVVATREVIGTGDQAADGGRLALTVLAGDDLTPAVQVDLGPLYEPGPG
ncbi:beta-propeller domain-containing protein [Aquipuribacter hungaricus]|uniref:Beta-propeller domain-containing protein n=1 Tax=Aquipuribacter hungaricus TaxID=545624 RepID=A0ABV7WEG3_9MICO